MIKMLELLLAEGKIEYPSNHKPGICVPKGGSMCANCKWWGNEENICNNKYWQEWAEIDKVPYPGDEYCCNWWEVK